jgi:hypothetical protein
MRTRFLIFPVRCYISKVEWSKNLQICIMHATMGESVSSIPNRYELRELEVGSIGVGVGGGGEGARGINQ